MDSDLVSVVVSFLSLQDQLKIERVCKEWKGGLYKYCASVKSFQISKNLLEQVVSTTPRPKRLMFTKCSSYTFSFQKEKTSFNNGVFIAPKCQHHRLIIRKMIGKWFSKMFIHVERVCFSDVRLSGELVEDFFPKTNNIKELVFVGCQLIKTCAKEFVKRMHNVECIIYHQNDLLDADLKHLQAFVTIPSLKYLYYPGADLVNLSKLKDSDKYSPYYFELEEDYSEDSEDTTDHQVMIFDLEKTKQFNKSKQSLNETLKLFGIISNEFLHLFSQALELPPNECILQLEKLCNNGMHFYDVNFEQDLVMTIYSNHWRNESVLKYFENDVDYCQNAVRICATLLDLAKSVDEKIEILQHYWNDFDRRNWYEENWYILSLCHTRFDILEEIIERKAIDISLKKFTGLTVYHGLIPKIKSCLKKRKELEKEESVAKKKKQ